MSEEIKQNIATAVANRKLLWYYTPSQNSAEELEGIFVQRESIAKDAVERIKEGALKDTKHHLLFVGPRGCGKTHLVSLIYHRLMAMKRVSSKLRVAWLNEDEMSPSFLDLLVRIYRALSSAYKDQFTESTIEPVYDLDIEDAEVFLRDLIIEKLGKQSLLVIVENLDELMKGLKMKGQMKWRAFIQDTKKCATLATAQKMVPAVKDRKAPFYGTFQVEHLDMLSEIEAVDLLKKVAVFYNDDELLEYLNTEPGRQRVECLHILTGGNHRVMIVLAQFVTKNSLEELIELFFKMLNELTPYYQERLRWISAQQRKIITFLCSSRPSRVNTMAKKLFISEQTLSSQLRDLLKMGYVKRDKIGRESIYQIAEPLMRMCIEVKENNHREPILLIIEFLKIWCNKETLMHQIQTCEKKESKSIGYLQKALETFDENEFVDQLKSCDDFSSFKRNRKLSNLIIGLNDILDGEGILHIYNGIIFGGIYEVYEKDEIHEILENRKYMENNPNLYHKLLRVHAILSIIHGDYSAGLESLSNSRVCREYKETAEFYIARSVALLMLKQYSSSLDQSLLGLGNVKSNINEQICISGIIVKTIVECKSWSVYFEKTEKVKIIEGLHEAVFISFFQSYLTGNIELLIMKKLLRELMIWASESSNYGKLQVALIVTNFAVETDVVESNPDTLFDLWRKIVSKKKIVGAFDCLVDIVNDYVESGTLDEQKFLSLNVEEREIIGDFMKRKNT